eukprot:15672-Heterococcus_DN1.PRE.1
MKRYPFCSDMTSSEALRRCEFDRDALRFEVASLTPLRDLLLSVDMNAFKLRCYVQAGKTCAISC